MYRSIGGRSQLVNMLSEHATFNVIHVHSLFTLSTVMYHVVMLNKLLELELELER